MARKENGVRREARTARAELAYRRGCGRRAMEGGRSNDAGRREVTWGREVPASAWVDNWVLCERKRGKRATQREEDGNDRKTFSEDGVAKEKRRHRVTLPQASRVKALRIPPLALDSLIPLGDYFEC